MTEPDPPFVLSVPPPLRDNPYQELLYEALMEEGVRILPPRRLDAPLLLGERSPRRILHVHWLWLKEGRLLRPFRLLRNSSLLLLARMLGWRILWTMHNLEPHEESRLETLQYAILGRLAHGIVVHGEWAAAELRRRRRRPPRLRVIPHGIYAGAYPPPPPREEARRRLGLRPDATVFLCTGQIRPYKGTANLIRSFRATTLRARLIIAGRPSSEALARRIREMAEGDERIVLDLRFLSREDVSLLHAAADWAVLPYRKITTSGALHLAQTFLLPAVLPAHPALREAAGPGTAVYHEGPEDLRRALEEAAGLDRTPYVAAIRRNREAHEWPLIARRLAAFMRELTA